MQPSDIAVVRIAHFISFSPIISFGIACRCSFPFIASATLASFPSRLFTSFVRALLLFLAFISFSFLSSLSCAYSVVKPFSLFIGVLLSHSWHAYKYLTAA